MDVVSCWLPFSVRGCTRHNTAFTNIYTFIQSVSQWVWQSFRSAYIELFTQRTRFVEIWREIHHIRKWEENCGVCVCVRVFGLNKCGINSRFVLFNYCQDGLFCVGRSALMYDFICWIQDKLMKSVAKPAAEQQSCWTISILRKMNYFASVSSKPRSRCSNSESMMNCLR